MDEFLRRRKKIQKTESFAPYIAGICRNTELKCRKAAENEKRTPQREREENKNAKETVKRIHTHTHTHTHARTHARTR